MKNGHAKKFESYTAHSSVRAGASARAILSAYKIEVRFLGGLTTPRRMRLRAPRIAGRK